MLIFYFRSLRVPAGQDAEVSVIPKYNVRITNAALGHNLVDAIGRSTVRIIFDSIQRQHLAKDTILEADLCSLIGGKVGQTNTVMRRRSYRSVSRKSNAP